MPPESESFRIHDHWEPLPFRGTRMDSLTTGRLLVRLMSNMGPVWNEFFAGAGRAAFERVLTEITDVLDRRDWSFFEVIDDSGRWNMRALEAAGRTRPRISLNCDLSTAGNLRIAVGPFEDDWTAFPLLRADGRRHSPANAMGFLRGMQTLLGPVPADAVQETLEGPSLADLVRRDLCALLLRAYRHCLVCASARFETVEDVSLEPVVVRIDGEAFNDRLVHVVLMDPYARAQRDMREDVLNRRVHEDRQERKDRAAAEAWLAEISAVRDPVVVMTAIERSEAADEPRKRAIAELSDAGIRATYLNYEERRDHLRRSLDLARPGWRGEALPAR